MDPVIIVGAVPVGLALALALARHSVPTVVLDEGPGKDEQRLARTTVLREDTAAFVERLAGHSFGDAESGARWAGWRSLRRKQVMRELSFDDETPSPLHLPQHVLTGALREALAAERLVTISTESKLDSLEQDASGLTAHSRGPKDTWWRGSYLVGCDGSRSTVRKLLDIRFPGRTAVERHAVAALRTELPWPGEALLHRMPPWRGGGAEVTGRPLAGGVWRLDWLLPPRGELVTPDALVLRIRETLAGWCGGSTPPYELLDTGVHTVHHRLARRWRVGRAFLAGDAAHLLGALGTQGLDEGLRDADNLAWKLALAWHHGPHDRCSTAIRPSGGPVWPHACAPPTNRCRCCAAAEACVPTCRGRRAGTTRSSRTAMSGAGRSAPPSSYADSPLAPVPSESQVAVGTESGAPSPTCRSPPPTGPSSSCGSGSGAVTFSSSWSRRARWCGSGGTG